MFASVRMTEGEGNMNLLIINDEELTADTMKEDINWKDYGIDEVFTAYEAEQAKEVIQSENVDIMLCDIEMPGDNGIELLRWVRQEEKPIECIFLTCHPSFAYAQEAISLNCQEYILIPARYEEIGKGVQKVVQRILKEQEMKRYEEYGRKAVQEQIDQAVETHGKKRTGKELAGDVARYISEHLGESELTVNELGKHFFVHPVYLNRIFKKEKAMPVSQYILTERMELAAQLLRSQTLSAGAVAEQVGYQQYTNFCNAFKKFYGDTPLEYTRKS